MLFTVATLGHFSEPNFLKVTANQLKEIDKEVPRVDLRADETPSHLVEQVCEFAIVHKLRGPLAVPASLSCQTSQ